MWATALENYSLPRWRRRLNLVVDTNADDFPKMASLPPRHLPPWPAETCSSYLLTQRASPPHALACKMQKTFPRVRHEALIVCCRQRAGSLFGGSGPPSNQLTYQLKEKSRLLGCFCRPLCWQLTLMPASVSTKGLLWLQGSRHMRCVLRDVRNGHQDQECCSLSMRLCQTSVGDSLVWMPWVTCWGSCG